jgi:Putative Phosphatase
MASSTVVPIAPSTCAKVKSCGTKRGMENNDPDCRTRTGKELDAFVAAHGGMDAYDQVFYVGDGKNDFCPLTRLRTHDVALVRVNRELAKKVKSDGDRLHCGITFWSGAWEIERFLKPFGP